MSIVGRDQHRHFCGAAFDADLVDDTDTHAGDGDGVVDAEAERRVEQKDVRLCIARGAAAEGKRQPDKDDDDADNDGAKDRFCLPVAAFHSDSCSRAA